MSSKWTESTLGEYITFKNGKSSPDRNEEDAIPVYGSNGIIGYSTQNNAPENCLVVGRVGSYCGSVYHSPKKCWVTDNAIIGLPKHEGESEFWYFLLLTLQLNSYRSGSGQPLINQSTLNSIPIKIPEAPKARSDIGKQLYIFNEKLELNTQTNQTLEQIAQAIFKSWFVDFDPVKAKTAVLEAGGTAEQAELAAMSAISAKDEAALKQLQTEQPAAYAELAQTAALFPSKMVDSELGKIPEGWNSSNIGKEVKVSGGGTPSTKIQEFWNGGSIHWSTPKDLSNLKDKVLTNTERKITEAGLTKISSGLLPVDTILMSSRAPVGYLAITKIPVAINQGYIAMQCDKTLPPEFVLQWAAYKMDEIKQRASGTTFAEISKNNFRPISIVVPPNEVVEPYRTKAKGLYDLITSLVIESYQLSQLRDSLLPKLLAGNYSLSGE